MITGPAINSFHIFNLFKDLDQKYKFAIRD